MHSTMMRLLGVMLWSTLLAQTAAVQAAQPLQVVQDHEAAIDHLLIALSQGKTEAWLSSADPAWFTAAIARSGDQGVVHHWTIDLLQALDRLPPEQRRQAEAVLDHHYQQAPTTPQRAAAFLTAPQAITALMAASARLFDTGQAHRFLIAAAQLDTIQPGWDPAPQRRQVARALIGRDSDPTIGSPWPTPGGLRSIQEVPALLPTDQGNTVRWLRDERLLMAIDAWGRTLWQFPLEHRRRQVITGPGGAIVDASHALILLNERGELSEWQRPHDTKAVAVADDAAWFTLDHSVYRLDLNTGSRQQFQLPHAPFGSPIIANNHSMWLTRQEIIVLDELGSISERWAHGLTIDDGALLLTRSGVVIATDSEQWLLTGPPATEAPISEQLAFLVQADRFEQALVLWQQAGKPSAHADLAVQAHIGLGSTSETVVREALTWSANPPWQARLLLAQGTAHTPHGQWHQQLLALAADHPHIFVPHGALKDPLAAHNAWPHQVRLGALMGTQALPTLTYEAERDSEFITVTGHTGQDLIWSHRLPSIGFERPGLDCVLRDDVLLVIEGTAWMTVLDPKTGTVLGNHRLPRIIPLEHLAANGATLAWIEPLHQPTRLHIRHHADEHVIELTTTAKSVTLIGNSVQTHHRDGRVLDWPISHSATGSASVETD